MDILTQTPEEMIVAEIKKRKKSIQWLADRVGIGWRHLYYVLVGKPEEKRKLSDGLKQRISEVLGKDF